MAPLRDSPDRPHVLADTADSVYSEAITDRLHDVKINRFETERLSETREATLVELRRADPADGTEAPT